MKRSVDDDRAAVAALGHRAVVVLAVVGHHHRRAGAVLLLAGEALLALAAGVDHAADADAVADREVGDGGSDLGDDPGDLMPGDQREEGAAEVVAAVVKVGVADAGVVDRDAHVTRAQVTPLDRRGFEISARGGELKAEVLVMPSKLGDSSFGKTGQSFDPTITLRIWMTIR